MLENGEKCASQTPKWRLQMYRFCPTQETFSKGAADQLPVNKQTD